jgi:hypothetical protein
MPPVEERTREGAETLDEAPLLGANLRCNPEFARETVIAGAPIQNFPLHEPSLQLMRSLCTSTAASQPLLDQLPTHTACNKPTRQAPSQPQTHMPHSPRGHICIALRRGPVVSPNSTVPYRLPEANRRLQGALHLTPLTLSDRFQHGGGLRCRPIACTRTRIVYGTVTSPCRRRLCGQPPKRHIP